MSGVSLASLLVVFTEKHMKKLSLMFAAFAALVSFNLRAEVVEIGNPGDFTTKIAANPAGDYKLTDNINLAGAGYATIPEFSGTLDGAGHTLSGLGAQSLCITNSGSIVGLTIDGAGTTWTQTDVGIFCSVSFGGKFSDCVVKGYTLMHKVAGAQKQNGLFAATAYDGSHFVRCATDASCSMDQNGKANNLQGGFVGQVTAINPVGIIAMFEDCTNNASVIASGDYNTGWGSGGFVGKIQNMNAASVPEVVFIRCANKGALTATGGSANIGGIVGHLLGGSSKDVSARARLVHCVNEGSLSSTVAHESAGGILGWSEAAPAVVMEGCVNRGEINCPSANYAGGLIGTYRTYASNVGECVFIRNCANYGDVTAKTAGGLFATFDVNTGWKNGKCAVYNSVNYGTVTGSTAGGELTAKVVCGSDASIVMDFCNCWATTANLIPSATGHAPDFTGTVTAADAGYTHEGAIASLNASGKSVYWPWVAGKDGRPELFQFVEASVSGSYMVFFCDWDGTVLKQEQVVAGEAATPPENPSRQSFEFTGWSRDYSSVTGNLNVYAEYDPLPFTFTFDSNGGSECAPQVYDYGEVVNLPIPTRVGFEFSCWMDGIAYKQFVICPNYNPSLKALWREVNEPRARKLTVVQWGCKPSDAGKRANMISALADTVINSAPDVLILTGFENNTSVVTAFESVFSGYTFTSCGCNGSSDGYARVVGYKTARFVHGEWFSIASASNATTDYLPLHEVGTDNYYIIFDMFSGITKGASTYIGSLKSVYDNARVKYPTATCIAGGSYSAFANDKDKEWSTKYGSDYTQALADLESKTGLTALQAGEDLQWTLYSCVHNPHTLTDVAVTKLENATVSDVPGYLTSFTLGVPSVAKGLMLLFR